MTTTPNPDTISKLKMIVRLATVAAAAFAATWLGLTAQERWLPRRGKAPAANLPGMSRGGKSAPVTAEDIPLPAGSRPIYPARRKTTRAGEWFQGWYAAPLTPPQAAAFYRKRLTAAGWRSGRTHMAGLEQAGNTLVYVRGQSRIKVSVAPPEPGREGSELWLSLEPRAVGGRPVVLHEKP